MQINVGLNARANVRVGVFSPDLIENFLRGEGNALRMILVQDRKSTRLNSSHSQISYAVFCLKKKKKATDRILTTTNLLSHSEGITSYRHVTLLPVDDQATIYNTTLLTNQRVIKHNDTCSTFS